MTSVSLPRRARSVLRRSVTLAGVSSWCERFHVSFGAASLSQ